MRSLIRLGITLAILLLLVGAIYYGSNQIGTTAYTFTSQRLSPVLDGFTIVHLSDFHNKKFPDGNRDLIARIEDAQPNIICITGDLIDRYNRDIEQAIEFIHSITSIAPVYFVNGNHEQYAGNYARLKPALIEAGVTVLDDEKTSVDFNGAKIQLAGLADPSFATNGIALLQTLIEDDSVFTLLLSHHPEEYEAYLAAGATLTLSGHAHGGAARIPFTNISLFAPDQGFFPYYTSGLIQDQDQGMIISRGIGNSVVPMRIFNRPEVVVITLRSENIAHFALPNT